jgi:uncharacterized protein YndB with AHSA1/START domain
MIATKETAYTRNDANKTITVVREFDAPVELVWKTWSEPELLEQWWAPKPWKAGTVSMDFREGGKWLYYMEGPDGSRHYARADYKSIVPNKSFAALDAFCDEKGNINTEFPQMNWNLTFSQSGSRTKVEILITFPTLADMEKIIEMGFKEGFAAAHGNLDELLAKLQA